MGEKIIKLYRKATSINVNEGKTIRCCCCGAKIGTVKTQKINEGATRYIVEIIDEEDYDISKQSLVVLVDLFKNFRSIGICAPCKHKIFEKYPMLEWTKEYSNNNIIA